MARRLRTAYRDTKTGRFVSKSTWTRSRSAGGVRYKRERINVPKRRKLAPPAPPAPPPFAKIDWLVTITVPGKRDVYPKKVRDFIVPAPEYATPRDIKKKLLEDVGPRLKPLIEYAFREELVTIAEQDKTRRRKSFFRKRTEAR